MLSDARRDPGLVDVVLLCVGVGGLLLSLVLVFMAMRAVMDIGGACADGGPYVSAQSCPDGATTALLLGVFGGFGFATLGAAYGSKVGGYGWVPILGWTALFASLGWNFLEYGLFNPPEGETVVWGWLIPGVMFQVMAWAPVALGIWAWWGTRRAAGSGAGSGATTASPAMEAAAVFLSGPGQPAAVHDDEDRFGHRPPPVPPSHRVEVAGPVRRDELREIDALMGALIVDAAADAPIDPDLRAAPDPTPATSSAAPSDAPSEGTEAFPEGTQALLDRLERLADMRDRGLLTPDDYETAKDAIMQELEGRQ